MQGYFFLNHTHNTFLHTPSVKLSVSSRPPTVWRKPCRVSLSNVPAAGGADSPRSPTAAPPGSTGSSPWPVRNTHLSHSAWPGAAATGWPERPRPPQAPAWSLCPPAEPGGSGHKGRPAWRGPRGRSSAPRRRQRGGPSGSGRACDVSPGFSPVWPTAGPATELRRRGKGGGRVDTQRYVSHVALAWKCSPVRSLSFQFIKQK